MTLIIIYATQLWILENYWLFRSHFYLLWKYLKFPRPFLRTKSIRSTDQVRRSSRSVCANIAEAYRKRRYVNHFISKLTDSDAENSETNVWLEFALECNYIDEIQFKTLNEKTIEVGRLINYMINNPQKFGCSDRN